MPRQRSTSAMEEELIDTYIESTVAFKSTVKFTDVRNVTPTSSVTSTVLLIGPLSELQQPSLKGLPIFCPVVAEVIKRIKEGQTISTLVQLPRTTAFTTVIVVAVTTEASRNNCPHRPDCYSAAVKSAIASLGGEKEHVMDIYVRAPAGAELAITAGIARGCPHSFTEIKGASTRSFLSQRVFVNIVFASPISFTGESVHRPTITEVELQNLATSVQLCQRLVDTPTDILDTVVFAEIAQRYAAQLNVDFQIIKGEALREKGYGGIYSVGKAAEFPPAIVTLRYTNPQVINGTNIALVGKGLVYDCGGLSLKVPSVYMSNMKTDMGGAAAVFAGFIAVVRDMKAQHHHYARIANLSVTLCLADNAVGPRAYRCDDILRMKSGKTVEVFNTDTEGRVCLGDGVFHATNEQEFIPHVLIDMATLTGVQGTTTGIRHAAIYSNQEEAEHGIMKAGRIGGDVCFPVLYCPEYHKEEYTSNLAEMRNLMRTVANANVSCGGHFVERHISERFKGAHIHVDLASPSSNADGATGYGVALVTEYLKSL